MLIKMAIIRRGPKSKLHVKWRSKAYGLVSRILGNSPEMFNNFLMGANREYVILSNNKHFRGFAVVRNNKNDVIVNLIGANTRPSKRPPAGQKGWGTQLMRAIQTNARKGGRSVRVHDPVFSANGFYRHLGYNTASNTSGGRRTMRRYPSPSPSATSRRLSPIAEKSNSGGSSRRQSPRSPRSASARRSPSK
jgi:hypothetical protein